MSHFKMKQFSIQQEKSAMKVGTDGVLLAAWTPLSKLENSILDVGSGTGIIALMMAQRSHAALIDAIELDENAFEECVNNFEASPWGDRLFCYHASFQEFVEEVDERYDLIVSNPPFYNQKDENRIKSPRTQARFTDSLYFEELISGSAHLLNKEGHLAVIIPYNEVDLFVSYAKKMALQLVQQCNVKGNINGGFKRSLLFFKKTTLHIQPKTTSLVIELSRHKYTSEYIALTKDFYLGL